MMSERISEILEVIRHVHDLYEQGMSERDARRLRIKVLQHVAQRRSIQITTVSDKFRRQLRPAINGTQQFDDALFGWLDSGNPLLQHALEKNAGQSKDVAIIREIFDDNILQQQVSDDLAALREEESSTEGKKSTRLVAYFERDPALRARAIAIHGTTCKACGFNFETRYGVHGKNYIVTEWFIESVMPLYQLRISLG